MAQVEAPRVHSEHSAGGLAPETQRKLTNNLSAESLVDAGALASIRQRAPLAIDLASVEAVSDLN